MGSMIANQVNNARVRARERGLSATISVDDWRRTLQDFENLCAYCGEPASTLDHYIPLAHQGGSDSDFSWVRFSQ